MKLYIPELGTKFSVTKKCTLSLKNERRNDSILDSILEMKDFSYSRYFTITVPIKIYDELETLRKKVTEPYYQESNRLRELHSKARGQDRIDLWDKIQKCYDDAHDELVKLIHKNYPGYKHLEYYDLDLVKGDVLTVDRIYIRKGQKDYSSVTFFLTRKGSKNRKRFWINLDQLDKINLKLIQ